MDPERRTLMERTLAKLGDENLMEDIISNTASGGTLIDLCKTWQVQYHRIVAFIYSDDSRKKSYEQALAARDEYYIERIRKELAAITSVDLRLAYDENGRLKDPKDWPDELASVIASVESFEEFEGSGNKREYVGDTKKIKLWDKLKAIELLGKNLKMFVDRHEVGLKTTLEDLLAASKKDTPAT